MALLKFILAPIITIFILCSLSLSVTGEQFPEVEGDKVAELSTHTQATTTSAHSKDIKVDYEDQHDSTYVYIDSASDSDEVSLGASTLQPDIIYSDYGSTSSSVAPEPPTRPNVILIIADDLVS